MASSAILLLNLVPLVIGRPIILIPPPGNETSPHEYPWLVSLTTDQDDHLCGATLFRICPNCIESDMVLTAAHCVVTRIPDTNFYFTRNLLDKESLKVVPGMHSIHDQNRDVYSVKNVAYHPGWDPLGTSGLRHDIALIQTEKPIKFTDKIKVIDLDKLDISVLEPLDRAKCRVAGWGGETHPSGIRVTPNLRDMNATITNGSICMTDHPQSYYYYDDKWMTCAESHIGTATACNGDSGGPLICDSPMGPIAHGVVSSGGRDCGDHKNTIYSTIRPHLMWIYATAINWSTFADKEFLEIEP